MSANLEYEDEGNRARVQRGVLRVVMITDYEDIEPRRLVAITDANQTHSSVDRMEPAAESQGSVEEKPKDCQCLLRR